MSPSRCPEAWSLARRVAREARTRQAAGTLDAPVRVQHLLQLHGEASMAVVLLVMAMVTLLPVAGVGTVLSFGILTWAWAWACQRESLPGLQRIAQLPLPQALGARALRWLARLHLLRARWMRARLQSLQSSTWRWVWALWVVCMALIILLPVPFGNVLPAASLLMFGLGLMARDGLLLLISLAPGAGGLAVLGFSAHWLLEWAATRIPW